MKLLFKYYIHKEIKNYLWLIFFLRGYKKL